LHTLVRSTFTRLLSNGAAVTLNVSQTIFNTHEAFEYVFKLNHDTTKKHSIKFLLTEKSAKADGVESIFLGMLSDAAAKYDTNIMDTLQNHLFEFTDASGNTQANDLLALNINRGRDHGLPSYNAIRKLCGFPLANNFNDLTNLMSPNSANLLGSIYR
jgi:hypothetical protein